MSAFNRANEFSVQKVPTLNLRELINSKCLFKKKNCRYIVFAQKITVIMVDFKVKYLYICANANSWYITPSKRFFYRAPSWGFIFFELSYQGQPVRRRVWKLQIRAKSQDFQHIHLSSWVNYIWMWISFLQGLFFFVQDIVSNVMCIISFGFLTKFIFSFESSVLW